MDLPGPMSGEDLPSLELGAQESQYWLSFAGVALVLAPLRAAAVRVPVLAARPGAACCHTVCWLLSYWAVGYTSLLPWAKPKYPNPKPLTQTLRAAGACLQSLRDLSDATAL